MRWAWVMFALAGCGRVAFEARSTGPGGTLALTGDLGSLTLSNVQTDSGTSPLQRLSLGIGFASSNAMVAQPALDVWLDDVIVNASPVTCAD